MEKPQITNSPKKFANALFQNLLVAYDSSDASQTALRYAITFANYFRSDVTVASVRSPADLALDIESSLGVRESSRQVIDDLEAVSRRLKISGISRRIVQRGGAVADVHAMLRYMRTDTHDRSYPARREKNLLASF